MMPRSCKQFRCYLFVGLKVLVQRRNTDFQPSLLKDISETALGQPSVKGHLPAFEADLARVTGARLLTFFTAAAVLPRPDPGPLPTRFFLCVEPFAGRTLLRLMAIINSPTFDFAGRNCRHHNRNFNLYSTMRNRCGTFATAPRIEGESGRSTIWLSFVKPRLRTICL